ncbi:LOW QUALITY PROTEIN: probable cytochrome P450 49a1 [Dermacentor silvarum]|uniref:LOW QUALITY PROTEIN: probable cytochrome P450 49a1 n=1 Tax=Dermacentor silvarum TaxID=543639 RepID=UPI0021006D7A|nr:LOW QUALITY PROTEIN: probable cytochrome P450 49a1 [Dermacentor silvarum]
MTGYLKRALSSVARAVDARDAAVAKPFSEIPKIPGLPVIGSSWMYLPLVGRYDVRDINHAAWDIHRRYGPIVAEQFAGRRVLVHLFRADDIRTLYQEEGRTPYRAGALPLKLYHEMRRDRYFANHGLANAQGEEWRRIRSSTQPFTTRPQTVLLYADAMDTIAADAVRLIGASRDGTGEVADCHPLMRRWAFESGMLVCLDRRLGVLQDPLDPESDAAVMMYSIQTVFEMLDTLVTGFPFYRYVTTPYWRTFVRRADATTERMFKVIQAAAEEAGQKHNKHNATILGYLQREGRLTTKEIFTFMMDFLVGAAESTSTAATFSLYCLAMNPDAQERARQEVVSVLCGAADGTLSEKYQKLSYVKACIREALRLHPIVPGVHRKLDHDVVMSGYIIPANTLMRTEPYVAGRLEENFTRASEFLPWRWLHSDEQASSKDKEAWMLHPFASLPFSVGPRMCIGRRIAEMELCLLVAKVLQQYRVENHHGDIGFQSRMTSRPMRPARFRFVEVEKATST